MTIDFRWLTCLVRDHDPIRLNGTFYVACRRCGDTINLRVSTWRKNAAD